MMKPLILPDLQTVQTARRNLHRAPFLDQTSQTICNKRFDREFIAYCNRI